MTTGGWIIMVLSVGGVTALFACCVWRVLRHRGEGDIARVQPVEEDEADLR